MLKVKCKINTLVSYFSKFEGFKQEANHCFCLFLLFFVSVRACVPPRRLWPVGRCSHREPTGEIPVRPGGIREEPVPKPAQPLWEAPAAAALPAHRLFVGNRAAVLRPLGR